MLDARSTSSALRLDTALVFDEVRALATVEERQRLAREIHDGVAQEIAVAGLPRRRPGRARVQRAPARQAARAARRDHPGRQRAAAVHLRPAQRGQHHRRARAPRCPTTSGPSGARSGLTVHLTLDEGPARLRSEVETELLRITQEAVTNARKHAEARQPLGRLPGPTAVRPHHRPGRRSRAGTTARPTPTASRSCGSGPSASARRSRSAQRQPETPVIGTTVAVTLGDSDA